MCGLEQGLAELLRIIEAEMKKEEEESGEPGSESYQGA
jgi:hypothetical protein